MDMFGSVYSVTQTHDHDAFDNRPHSVPWAVVAGTDNSIGNPIPYSKHHLYICGYSTDVLPIQNWVQDLRCYLDFAQLGL